MPGQPTEGTSPAPEIPAELSTNEAAKIFEGLLGPDDDGPELSTDKTVESDDPEEGEGSEAPVEGDEESAEGEGSDDEQPEGDQQEPIRTVAELAEALELSQEELAANLKTTARLEGDHWVLKGLVYLVYTYASYAFAVQYNPLFLIYIALLGCSLYALIGRPRNTRYGWG